MELNEIGCGVTGKQFKLKPFQGSQRHGKYEKMQ